MHWKLRSLAALLVLASALTLGGVAAAGKRPQQAQRPGGLVAAAFKGAADYLGVKPGELRRSVRAGQSLAALATAQGKSVEGLQEAMLAAVKARLDALVAAGNLTAERAQTLLARMQTRIAALVNRTGTAPRGQRGHHLGLGHVLKRAAAEYLGLTPAQLRTQLKAGQSLAQIAVAQGKSVDGLQQAMLAAAKARLDALVAAGKLTPERAQAILARLPERIARLVNRS